MRPSSASTPLSSSALNYLESLERNAKALRGNNNRKDDNSSITSTSKPTSSIAPVKRRESFSEIINQARRQASLSRTDSEDFDFLNESLKSSVFSDSSDSESEESHEESHEGKRILPLGTPGQQVGRKSLKDIRELRNSIDQSLIKTPELKMLRNKVTEDSKKHAHFESIREEEVPEVIPKTQLPSKSPFKKAIQSGSESSDSDSIIFDEVFEEVLPSPPRKPTPVRAQTAPAAVVQPVTAQKPMVEKKETKKKKEKTPTPSSSSSESSSESKSESSSNSESSESSSSESSSSSSSSSKSSASKASTKQDYPSDFGSEKSSSSTIPKVSIEKPPLKNSNKPKENPKKPSPVPYEDFIPKIGSSSDSGKSTVRETHRTFEESIDKLKLENKKGKEEKNPAKEERNKSFEKKLQIKERTARRSSSSASSSTVGETEKEMEISKRRQKKFRSRRMRSEEPQTCQTNIHNMIESVIDTHVQMLDEFNQMEYAAVCEWTQVLRRFDRHDGPTSQRLREIVQQRLNRKY
ncbi:hypothetical protein GCK72_005522 [Caenorhabditis remanei]|uniref:Uncharacterized protein n=1 Tax=Caenorhabditis remanei TaxID=31234 RepID=A0A6A5HCS7_CAERE|nr:hypothetical protein GCK72_005522 [Caenorhabditis remanei]KAF1765570.1 hypothetical protein GCK72_005522 [Caenorhabditis remanei]